MISFFFLIFFSVLDISISERRETCVSRCEIKERRRPFSKSARRERSTRAKSRKSAGRELQQQFFSPSVFLAFCTKGFAIETTAFVLPPKSSREREKMNRFPQRGRTPFLFVLQRVALLFALMVTTTTMKTTTATTREKTTSVKNCFF